MIKYVRLVNIENHLDTRIGFDPKINMITGVTDSGKSAILRAILSIFYCDEMTLHYEKDEGFIEVGIDDKVIRRTRVEQLEKKKCSNCSYKFEVICQKCPSCGHFQKRKKVDDYYEIDGKRSLKSGIEVPPDIAQYFNTDLLQLDDGERVSVNFFEKNQVPSFVDLKPSQRMAIIGSMGQNLILLDEKLKRNYKNLKELKTENKDSVKKQKILQNKIQDLSDLDSIKEKVDELKEIKEKLKKHKENQEEIFSMLKEINRIQQLLIIYGKLDNIEKLDIEDLVNIENNFKKQRKNQNEMGILKIIKDIKTVNVDLENFVFVKKILNELTKKIFKFPSISKFNFDIRGYKVLNEMENIRLFGLSLKEEIATKKEELYELKDI